MLLPSYNDRTYDLWLKIAVNTYESALSTGATGLTPPSLNDRLFDLQKKVTYYTAMIAS